MTEKKLQNENTQNNEVLTPFTNDLKFALVMRDPDICRGIAELLLPDEEIGEVIIATPDNPLFDENSDFEVMVQASLDFGKDMRGNRFENGLVPICVSILMERPSANRSPALDGYEPTALCRRVPHDKALHS